MVVRRATIEDWQEDAEAAAVAAAAAAAAVSGAENLPFFFWTSVR